MLVLWENEKIRMYLYRILNLWYGYPSLIGVTYVFESEHSQPVNDVYDNTYIKYETREINFFIIQITYNLLFCCMVKVKRILLGDVDE